MHILLVEDDAAMAAYVQKGLHECGHTVDVAASGRDIAQAGRSRTRPAGAQSHPRRASWGCQSA